MAPPPRRSRPSSPTESDDDDERDEQSLHDIVRDIVRDEVRDEVRIGLHNARTEHSRAAAHNIVDAAKALMELVDKGAPELYEEVPFDVRRARAMLFQLRKESDLSKRTRTDFRDFLADTRANFEHSHHERARLYNRVEAMNAQLYNMRRKVRALESKLDAQSSVYDDSLTREFLASEGIAPARTHGVSDLFCTEGDFDTPPNNARSRRATSY